MPAAASAPVAYGEEFDSAFDVRDLLRAWTSRRFPAVDSDCIESLKLKGACTAQVSCTAANCSFGTVVQRVAEGLWKIIGTVNLVHSCTYRTRLVSDSDGSETPDPPSSAAELASTSRTSQPLAIQRKKIVKAVKKDPHPPQTKAKQCKLVVASLPTPHTTSVEADSRDEVRLRKAKKRARAAWIMQALRHLSATIDQSHFSSRSKRQVANYRLNQRKIAAASRSIARVQEGQEDTACQLGCGRTFSSAEEAHLHAVYSCARRAEGPEKYRKFVCEWGCRETFTTWDRLRVHDELLDC